MEQARSLMWAKRKQGLSSNLQVAKSKTSAYDNNSWEEEAFAEDTSGSLGGCTWPPRSYSCSFCSREFRSAQALGGHMNVHRRDRARLKQSSSPVNPNNNIEIFLNQNNYHQNTISSVQNPLYSNPNSDVGVNISSTTSPSTKISIATPACKENYCDYKKTLCLPAAAYNSFSNLQEHPRLIRSTVSSSSTQSWSNMDESARYYYQDAGEKTSKLVIMESEGNKVKGDCCETSLSLVVCKEEGCNNKRRKIDLPSSSMSSFLKPSPVHTIFIDQPDKLFEVSPLNSLEELDLELRLGDRPKLKY